ncbi:glycogen debranching protein GlgX [Kineococcus rubinsiae]|uniref:glycogen debranching protein GlgX n=1 Tax=Kineococcus rubinsiae TaxID=2609562 RepID=UPI0014318924|nr:glycogen debranching protein GlgX [Kineococcus rubinsiae]NIZ91203.1 glycogen debranching protein GlgX [Kineococcus rubinsiae]
MDHPAAGRSTPYPLGLTLRPDGLNAAVYSETADAVDVAVFDDDGKETRHRLEQRTGHVFHGLVPGGVGTRYGLRVHGEWEPAEGLRHNAAKLLLDPYAQAVEGQWGAGEETFGHRFDDPEERNDADSAPSVPRGVVVDPAFDWEGDEAPRTPTEETVVYEVHVKGFTQLHPDVPEEVRGTYAGLAHPAAIKHLTDLGVTAVELLPVHQFVQDSHLLEKGLRNYWGYNSIGFFAPHNEYSSAGDGGGQVAEFKAMVKALHAAGLEVILDVVYNHTAEGNHLGPTLSLKGIDNGSYYRVVEEEPENYFDTTGTGNSLNVSHPAALQLILDSLRYWVTEMHVDGFRFDLATTLTRQWGEAHAHSAFLDIVHQDPVLAPVKLIAEPWDTQGYQVGGFPARWAEWNGKYRDDVRDFWRGEGSLGALTQRITGSPDVYEADRRSPLSSVNFITAHDGFTLADLTAYDEKHNDANGEDGNDGESDNRSWGGGAEGPTDDEAVNALRERQRRNLMTTLLLSAGIPMILGGDELGRTQGGNNNAYCQDDEISWFDWAAVDTDLLGYTRELLTLRRETPALRARRYRGNGEDGSLDAVLALRADGKPMTQDEWDDGNARAYGMQFSAEDSATVLLLVNGATNPVEFSVPPAPAGAWKLVVSSDPQQEVGREVSDLLVGEWSTTVLRSA